MGRTADTMSEMYEVTMVDTIDGAPHEEKALYRGNPFRNPNAELVKGRDLVRGDNDIYMNSGTALGTHDSPHKITVTWN